MVKLWRPSLRDFFIIIRTTKTGIPRSKIKKLKSVTCLVVGTGGDLLLQIFKRRLLRSSRQLQSAVSSEFGTPPLTKDPEESVVSEFTGSHEHHLEAHAPPADSIILIFF